MYGQCFDDLWHKCIQPGLLNALSNNRYLLGSGKSPIIYIGNHDHWHVAWQACARNNVGALEWYCTQPYFIAIMIASGAPMVRNGQEFAEISWTPEDDQGSNNRRVQSRPLHWDYSNDKFGKVLRNGL